MPATWRISGRLLPPLAAATLLLILFEVHTAVFRLPQTLLGLRPDTPVILGTIDACGSFSPRIAAFAEFNSTDRLEGGPPDARCRRSIDIMAGAPRGSAVALFLDHRLVAVRGGGGDRIARFENVALPPHPVELRVVGLGARAWMPFGVDRAPARLAPAAGARLRVPSPFGETSIAADLDVVEAVGPPPPPARLLGRWDLPGGERVAVVSATPLQAVDPEALGIDAGFRGQFPAGPDGLVLLRERVPEGGDRPPAAPPALRRELSLRVEDGGMVSVEAEACLPRDHHLLLRGEATSGGEPLPIAGEIFVARLFGLQVGRWDEVAAFADRPPAPVVLAPEPETAEGCMVAATAFSLERASFVLGGFASMPFPNAPGDRLEAVGLTPGVEVRGRVPDLREGDSQTWVGSAATLRGAALSIEGWWRAGPGPDRVGAPPGPGRGPSVFADLRGAFDQLPGWIQWVLWGLSAVAPVALMLWVVATRMAPTPPTETAGRVVAGLSALLAFGAAYAVQPAVTLLARELADLLGLAGVLRDYVTPRGLGQGFTAPLALPIVALIGPLLDRGRDGRPATALSVSGHLGHALPTVGIAAAGVGLPFMQYALADPQVSRLILAEFADGIDATFGIGAAAPLAAFGEADAASVALILTMAAWLGLGLLSFWIPVRWVVRSAGGRVGLGGAFVASLLVFVVPLAPSAFEVGAQLMSFLRGTLHAFGPPSRSLASALEAGALHAPYAILLLLASLVLLGFRRIGLTVLPEDDAAAVARRTPRWSMVALAGLVVAPLPGAGALDEGGLNCTVAQLMSVFQTYAPVLALVAAFTVFREVGRGAGAAAAGPFRPPEAVFLVCAAGFAGYMAAWDRHPVSLLLAMGLGWLAFSRLILRPPLDIDADDRPAGLAGALLAHCRAMQAAQRMEDALGKAAASGSVTEREVRRRTDLIDWARRRADAALGRDPAEAKFLLLAFGPKASPLSNAVLGATAGLSVALLMQLFLPFSADLAPAEGSSSWTRFLQVLLTDPAHRLIPVPADASVVLLVPARFLNAITLWVVSGFLFGYAFHRIRGGDGFARAAVFAAGIAGAYLLSQAILGTGGGGVAASLGRPVPVTVFPLVLGAVIFDGGSLRRDGAGLGALVEVYGLKARLGYASLASALALAQPILALVDSPTR